MGIELTNKAAQRVEHFLKQRGSGVGLRLGLKRTGCSGWQYVVDFADEVGEDDAVFEDRGVTIVVDNEALPLLAGTRVDFVAQGLNQTFVFNNPNVGEECGCGESFTINAA